jgi:DNA-directed RNA polymerase subunit RPC12/RpoP
MKKNKRYLLGLPCPACGSKISLLKMRDGLHCPACSSELHPKNHLVGFFITMLIWLVLDLSIPILLGKVILGYILDAIIVLPLFVVLTKLTTRLELKERKT